MDPMGSLSDKAIQVSTLSQGAEDNENPTHTRANKDQQEGNFEVNTNTAARSKLGVNTLGWQVAQSKRMNFGSWFVLSWIF